MDRKHFLLACLKYEMWLRKGPRLRRKVEKVKRKIDYIQERIATRQKITVWDHLRAGAKDAGVAAARCREVQDG